MYVEDTIVAAATPAGNGAVAIVRLSGPKTFEILRAIWRPVGTSELKPRILHLGDIVDAETGIQLDRAMAVIFPKPRSLTGRGCCGIAMPWWERILCTGSPASRCG